MKVEVHDVERLRKILCTDYLDRSKGLINAIRQHVQKAREIEASSEERTQKITNPDRKDVNELDCITLLKTPKPRRSRKRLLPKTVLPIHEDVEVNSCQSSVEPEKRGRRKAAIKASEKIFNDVSVPLNSKLRRGSNHQLIYQKKKKADLDQSVSTNNTYITASSTITDTEVNETTNATVSTETRLEEPNCSSESDKYIETTDATLVKSALNPQTSYTFHIADAISPLDKCQNSTLINYGQCMSKDSGVGMRESSPNTSQAVNATYQLHGNQTVSKLDEIAESPSEDFLSQSDNLSTVFPLSSTAQKWKCSLIMSRHSSELSPVVSVERLPDSALADNTQCFKENENFSVKKKVEYFNNKAQSESKNRPIAGKSGVHVAKFLSENKLRKLNRHSLRRNSVSKHKSEKQLKANLSNLLKQSEKTFLNPRDTENMHLNRSNIKYSNLVTNAKTLVVTKPVLTAANVSKMIKPAEKLRRESDAKLRKKQLLEKKQKELREKNERRIKLAKENKMALEKKNKLHQNEIQEQLYHKDQKLLKAHKLDKEYRKMVCAEESTPNPVVVKNVGLKKTDQVNELSSCHEDPLDAYNMTLNPNTNTPDKNIKSPAWCKTSNIVLQFKAMSVPFCEIFGKLNPRVNVECMLGVEFRPRASSIWKNSICEHDE